MCLYCTTVSLLTFKRPIDVLTRMRQNFCATQIIPNLSDKKKMLRLVQFWVIQPMPEQLVTLRQTLSLFLSLRDMQLG